MCQDDSRAHDVLLCIQTGKSVHDPNRMKFYTDQFYFKSYQEMHRVFGDHPELLSRTIDIANRCSLELQPIDNPFPEFEPLHRRHGRGDHASRRRRRIPVGQLAAAAGDDAGAGKQCSQ
jgi:DNA polymerase III alpha subunit